MTGLSAEAPLLKIGSIGHHEIGGAKHVEGAAGFEETLVQVMEGMVQPQQQAQAAVETFAGGTDGRIHETMLAVEKADINFRYMMSLRNRLLDVYQEIMRMGM